MTSREVLDFYRQPGALMDLAPHQHLPTADSPAEAARIVQGLILHEHMAGGYGVALEEDRRAEVHTRRLTDMLTTAERLCGDELTVARPPAARWIGNCRHFSMVSVAMLRQAGVPARARCGFGMYFGDGKGVDHWVVEYWTGTHWLLADTQIDDVQSGWFKADFDLMDVPRDKFWVAGYAWRQCRSGRADPANFGIMTECGLWFIAGNIIRDVAALNGVELLPWDSWGAMPGPKDDWSDSELAWFDTLAEMTVEPDEHFTELRERFQRDRGLSVPSRVFNVIRDRMEAV